MSLGAERADWAVFRRKVADSVEELVLAEMGLSPTPHIPPQGHLSTLHIPPQDEIQEAI